MIKVKLYIMGRLKDGIEIKDGFPRQKEKLMINLAAEELKKRNVLHLRKTPSWEIVVNLKSKI